MRLFSSAAAALPFLTFLAPIVAAQNNAPNSLPDLSQSDSKASSAAPKGSSSAAAATKTDSASKPALISASTAAPTTNNAKTTAAASLPAITSDAPTQAYNGITDAPKLSGFYSYPPPTVPPTANAPFMQTSSLPQGTVFIAVGAALGAAFFVVLAWRGLVAWSLARSVRRTPGGAAQELFARLGKKGLLGGGTGDAVGAASARGKPFYTQVPGSTMSLNLLSGEGKKGYYNPRANGSGSLFFSPTAAVTGAQSSSTLGVPGQHHPQLQPGHRGSGYLPAGYYAAGASAVGGGVAANGRPVSMADFTGGNDNPTGQRGYSHFPARGATISPGPPSPSLTNTSTGGILPRATPDLPYGRSAAGARLSTASLARSEGRAPSTYLEEMFDMPPMPER